MERNELTERMASQKITIFLTKLALYYLLEDFFLTPPSIWESVLYLGFCAKYCKIGFIMDQLK